jgi:hypothetical protein
MWVPSRLALPATGADAYCDPRLGRPASEGSQVDLQAAIERYHHAADVFSRGDPEAVKALYSHSDDVALADPFGSTVRGWTEVSAALDYASSRFRDGAVIGFETIASYASSELACSSSSSGGARGSPAGRTSRRSRCGSRASLAWRVTPGGSCFDTRIPTPRWTRTAPCAARSRASAGSGRQGGLWSSGRWSPWRWTIRHSPPSRR